MPIWLRSFTYSKIKEYHETIAAKREKEQGIITANTDKKAIKRLGIDPNSQYSTKAPIPK